MKRDILFRGINFQREWVYGDLFHSYANDDIAIAYYREGSKTPTFDAIFPESFGQYTGLKDKNGNKIFEGDIIEYYELGTYCINPDCDIHLLGYGSSLEKKLGVVQFENGIFGVNDESDYPLTPLSGCGIYEDMLNDMKEDTYLKTNGFNIGNSIIGIKVIANIHDNPELME